jgi:hypothetical protein
MTKKINHRVYPIGFFIRTYKTYYKLNKEDFAQKFRYHYTTYKNRFGVGTPVIKQNEPTLLALANALGISLKALNKIFTKITRIECELAAMDFTLKTFSRLEKKNMKEFQLLINRIENLT